MRRLLLVTALWICAAQCGAVIGTGSVLAVGAPSENYTVPDSPLNDPAHDEIKPNVDFVQAGPGSLPKSPPPAFSLEFSGPSSQDKNRVTAAENWYLFVDTSTAGWLYIYEDYPPRSDPPGRWLAYKWQLPQGGLWRLGPFSTTPNEPEGQHIYHAWFYGDGQWAGQSPQNNPVTWTYLKSLSMEKPPETPPVTPVKEETPAEAALKFFTHPAVLLTGPTVIILLALLVVYLTRAYRRRARLATAPASASSSAPEPLQLIEALPADIPRASLALPNGTEIQLAGGKDHVIGRADLARALGLDELGLISRQHFRVICADGHFYLADAASGNGTHLNGEEIAGRGAVEVKHNDVIELPGVIRIKFHLL